MRVDEAKRSGSITSRLKETDSTENRAENTGVEIQDWASRPQIATINHTDVALIEQRQKTRKSLLTEHGRPHRSAQDFYQLLQIVKK